MAVSANKRAIFVFNIIIITFWDYVKYFYTKTVIRAALARFQDLDAHLLLIVYHLIKIFLVICLFRTYM